MNDILSPFFISLIPSNCFAALMCCGIVFVYSDGAVRLTLNVKSSILAVAKVFAEACSKAEICFFAFFTFIVFFFLIIETLVQKIIF